MPLRSWIVTECQRMSPLTGSVVTGRAVLQVGKTLTLSDRFAPTSEVGARGRARPSPAATLV